MLIFNEENKPTIIDNMHGPNPSEYMYVLDLNMMDYTLAPLLVFEEIQCASVQLTIRGFSFVLPGHWQILVADDETYQLDVIEVAELPGANFKALVYGLDMSMFTLEDITLSDFYTDYNNVGPSLNKHQMLCHPISENCWVNVATSDSYNKYLKGKLAGDLI